MTKKNDIDSVLPAPNELALAAAKVDFEHLDKVAVRRAKVRELMRMGYEPSQIALALRNGVKIGEGDDERIIKIPSSLQTVGRDISYIKTEMLATDEDLLEKRGEILDKLSFLYSQSIGEFKAAKGAVRNSFLNTALAVLDKISKIEGIESPENLNVNLSAEARITKFAAEIHKLSEDDKTTILSAIRKIREKRQSDGDGQPGVPSSTLDVRVQTSDDEGVSRKS